MLRVPLKQACDSNDSVYRTSYLTTRRWRDPQIPLRRILGMQYAQGILSLSRDVTSCGESVTQSGKNKTKWGRGVALRRSCLDSGGFSKGWRTLKCQWFSRLLNLFVDPPAEVDSGGALVGRSRLRLMLPLMPLI